MAKPDVSLLYKALGFSGDDKEMVSLIKPIEVPDTGKKLSTFDLLDETITSSQYGQEADALWLRVRGLTKMGQVPIPAGIDLPAIKARLVAELNASQGARSLSTITTELSACPAVAKEDDFI